MRTLSRAVFRLSTTASLLAACSTASVWIGPGETRIDGGVGAASCEAPDASGFVAAPHPAHPEVPDEGAGIVAEPLLAEVSFASDPNAARHERYVEALAASRWAGLAGEYGIARPTLLRHTRLRAAAPAEVTATDLGTFVNAALDRGDIPGADVDPARLVVLIYLPRGTTLLAGQLSDSEPSCDHSIALHTFYRRGGRRMPLAVVPTCDAHVPGLDAEGVEQVAASHEYIESVTNPAANLLSVGRALPPTTQTPWIVLGPEVADLCGPTWVTEGGVRYARFYSNEAARRGDPCATGDDATPAFGVAVDQPQRTPIRPGETLTLTVTGWSAAPSCAWDVTLEAGGRFPLEASIDRSWMNNGDTARLTVRAPANADPTWPAWVTLYATRGDGRVSHWPVGFRVVTR